MARPARPGRLARLLIGAGLLGCCACAGSGRVDMVPFVRTDLAPGEPLTRTIPLHTACYAAEADDHLIIGLEHHRGSLFGKAFEADWRLALRLNGLPAGRQRLYRLGPDSIKLALAAGGDVRRAQLFSGVVLLEAPDRAGRMRGRFHITVRQQQFNLLTGWSMGGLVVNTGEFDAVRDAQRARAIDAATEAGVFGPASLPAQPLRILGPIPAPSQPFAPSTMPQ